MPAIARSLDVSRIPVFEHIGTKLHPDDALWNQQDLDALSIRATRSKEHKSDTSLHIVPTHGRWRRAYHIQTHGRAEQCPIRALPALMTVGQCVAYLRVDGEHIIALLQAEWPALSALRDLRVDYRWDGTRAPEIWPPFAQQDESAQERRRYVSCPALETLTICACDATVNLASRDVALLGGALAQCGERAALVLVGVELEAPLDDALLRGTFSSVRSCAFGSSWDRDEGLWDEGW